jgi:phosphotransferase system  glucose/maltose/N-acetylglucosamine-specific IIC component
MLSAIIIWLALAIVIGIAAARRGRSGLGWLVASLIVSPLIAAILLALLPDRRYEEVLSRLAAQNAAAANPRLTSHEK